MAPLRSLKPFGPQFNRRPRTVQGVIVESSHEDTPGLFCKHKAYWSSVRSNCQSFVVASVGGKRGKVGARNEVYPRRKYLYALRASVESR